MVDEAFRMATTQNQEENTFCQKNQANPTYGNHLRGG